MLYVHMGDSTDSASAGPTDTREGPADRRTATPPDNPFFNAADRITATDFVYEYGVRSPFGGGWRSPDQSHYVVETDRASTGYRSW
jgi:glucose/arabinose dehydrogenase